MLVLSRREGQRIIIHSGNDVIEIGVSGIRDDTVRLTFDAPRHITINREEIQQRIDRESA